jgi:uncharacterized membrane protein
MATSATSRRSPILLHPIFVGMGAAAFIAAFITDYMYSTTSLMQWANFSAWLIAGGLVLALIAAIALLVDILLGAGARISWGHFIVLTIVVLLSIVNVLVHSRDAWTSVVPQGIILSAIVTVLLLVSGIRGWSVIALRAPVEGDRA